MSVQSEIDRIKGNVSDAYAAVSEMGGTVPEKKNSAGLKRAIESIPSVAGGIQLKSISITTPPKKTTYSAGNTFDPAGMVVKATFSDGQELLLDNSNLTFSPSGAMDTSVTSITASFQFGGKTVSAAQEITVKSTKIYGVSWDGTSTTKWSRTDDAAEFTDPVPYVAGASGYGSPFDNLYPWSGMVKSERTGGTMVAIPKFWYKLTQNGNGMTIQIADHETEGFVTSPAHMDRGDGKGERDVVYVGRYHCASDYKSKTGVKPIANITRSAARAGIHNLGADIWQMDFATRFSIWILYLVEFADWNSQETIGKGCGNVSGTGNMGYTDGMPYHTGTTQSSRDTYGLGTQYRNIEGLWDNVMDCEDGCYRSSAGLNIILNPNNYSDTTGGISVGTPSDGFPSLFTVNSNAGFPVFIPTVSNGGYTTYSCDLWLFSASVPVSCVGGDYRQSGGFGMFHRSRVMITESLANVGSRLHELP